MLWAQITLLVLFVCSFAFNMYTEAKTDKMPVATFIGNCIGFGIAFYAGGFDKIFGYPQ
jgi:hypothetical protein